MWNCMGLTPVKRCLTGRWETLNDSLIEAASIQFIFFFPEDFDHPKVFSFLFSFSRSLASLTRGFS